MANENGPSLRQSLTVSLVLTTLITCFGSSMLYGYNMAVINLPEKHIQCFLADTILNKPCDKAVNKTVNVLKPGPAGSEATAISPTSETKPEDKSGIDAKFLYAQISSVFVVAGAIGAFSTGFVADYIGRRNGLLVNHVFVIIGGVLCAPVVYAKLPALLYVGRFFIGINCGVTIGLASMYLTEIAPRELRGAIGACHQLAVTLGIVIGYLVTLSQLLNKYDLWPIAMSLTAVPALISLVTLPFCPESPRFLFLKKHQKEAAKAAFIRINKTDDPDLVISELNEEEEVAKNQPPFKFLQLFTMRDLRMPLIIACLIQIMQQLSGINAVVSYSNIMLKNAGVPEGYSQYCVVGIGLLNVICTVISLPMLERFGRRTLLLWPSVVLAASLLFLTIFVNLANSGDESTKRVYGIISACFIFIYIAGFALGLGPVPALIVAEIFRQGPRGAAYSVSQCIQWTSALLVLFSYPSMNHAIGGYSFLPFLVVVVVCWVFFFLFMPETRNRTFDDVARDLAFGNIVVGKKTATINYEGVELATKKEGDPLLLKQQQAEVTGESSAHVA